MTNRTCKENREVLQTGWPFYANRKFFCGCSTMRHQLIDSAVVWSRTVARSIRSFEWRRLICNTKWWGDESKAKPRIVERIKIFLDIFIHIDRMRLLLALGETKIWICGIRVTSSWKKEKKQKTRHCITINFKNFLIWCEIFMRFNARLGDIYARGEKDPTEVSKSSFGFYLCDRISIAAAKIRVGYIWGLIFV